MQEIRKLRAEAIQTPLPEERDDGQREGSERVAETAGTSAEIREIGGPKGVEPTRFGDWERAGRCIDF
jgi:hypothetical protein